MLHKVLYITRNGVEIEVRLDALVNYMADRARHNRTRRATIHFAKAKVVGPPTMNSPDTEREMNR